MFSLALVAFIAGVLTILAPCVLPVLPVILAGSLSEKKSWYPYVVTASLAVSVVLFTVLLKASTALIDIPESFWKYLSGSILLALGLVYLFPHVWARIAEFFHFSKSNASLDHAQDIGNPLLRAIVTGAVLGPVFSTCSPTYSLLLATVFPVSLIAGIAYTFVYAIWLSLMLTIIAVGGRKIIAKFQGVADERGWFKKSLGIIFIIIGLAIISGIDKQIETAIIERFNVNSIEEGVLDRLFPAEQKPTEQNPPNPLWQGGTEPTKSGINLVGNQPASSGGLTKPALNVADPYDAPELTGLTDWINSNPLTMAALRWKVVVIDFWTYSCINCQRTLPYLVEWDKKYRDQWLVIIGVHAPEFAFEHIRSNVEKAARDDGITYPIALDNNFTLWNAYHNRYWPAKYFIDREGKVRHTHFGEGAYDESEQVIQELLGIPATPITTLVPAPASTGNQSPETYLGTDRRANYVPDAKTLLSNQWTLGGTWQAGEQSITATDKATLRYNYSARDVYLVLGGTGTLSVTVDGKVQNPGSDVKNGTITVDSDRMYHVVHSDNFGQNQLLELQFSPGVRAYAFTFGS